MKIDPGIATVVGALIAACAVIVVALINRSRKGRSVLSQVKGAITKPAAGETVSRSIYCEGTASAGDPQEEITFWLAVETIGLVWPKDAIVIPDKSGYWSATIQEEVSPESFAVSLWVATAVGTKNIQSWFEKGRSTGEYPGMSILSGTRPIGRGWEGHTMSLIESH